MGGTRMSATSRSRSAPFEGGSGAGTNGRRAGPGKAATLGKLEELDAELDPGASTWETSRRRRIGPEQWARFEGYVAEVFEAFGMDLDTPGTIRTPERFLRALYDSTAGYEGDPKLLTAFPTECRGGPDCRISQVIEGPIPFFSLCEHHSLPFYGVAYIGYIAHVHIIGISKLTRLVRLFAKRFTVQERLGRQIAGPLTPKFGPPGRGVDV